MRKSSSASLQCVLTCDLCHTCADRGGQSRCSFDECPPSSTYDIVEEYALDSDAWLRDFVCAYEKMVSSGAADLKTPSGDF